MNIDMSARRCDMYCPGCGHQLPENARFCGSCGRALGQGNHAIAEQWVGSTMTLLVIGTLLIPLLGIIMGIIGLTQPAKKRQGGWLLGLALFSIFICILILIIASE
jgi:hypothetical protein